MKQENMKCSACGENRGEYFKYDPVTRTTYCVTCRNKTIVQNSVDDVDKLMEAIKQNGLDNSEGYAKLAAMCQEQIDRTGETILKLETVIGFVGDVREEVKELRNEVKSQGEEIKSYGQKIDRQGAKIDKLLSKSEQEVENLRAQLRAAMSEKYISGEKVKDFAKELLKKSADDFLANFCEVVYSDDPQRLNAFLDSIDSSKDIADVELIIEFLLNDLQSENVTSLKCLVGKLSLQAKYIDRIENEAEKIDEGIYNPKLKRDIFVAFAGADEGRVAPIVNYFVEQGFDVYFSLTNLRHGKAAKEVYWKELHEALSNCKCLVFCSSNNSRKNGCDALIELEYVSSILNKSANMGIGMYEYILDEYTDRTPKLIKNTLKEYFKNRSYYTDLDSLSSAIYKFIQSKKLQSLTETIASDDDVAAEKREVPTEDYEYDVVADDEEATQYDYVADEESAAEIVVEEKSKPQKNKTQESLFEKRSQPKKKDEDILNIALENYDKSSFIIKGTALKKCKIKNGKVVIPYGVTSISDSAFKKCKKITSVVIPNSVKSIGKKAFASCSSLESIAIPSSVEHIGQDAFFHCRRLKSVKIPSSLSSLDKFVFFGCSRLRSVEIESGLTNIGNFVFYGCKNLTEIVIPSSVTDIGNYVFYGCNNLTSIDIPGGVESIGDKAFSGCRKLKAIRYGGTKSDWEKLKVKESGNWKRKGVVIHCSDGEIKSLFWWAMHSLKKIGSYFIKKM